MANKVHIAVVGAGYWGKNHIRTLDELNALGAIVESNEIKRNEILSLYPQIKVVNRLEALDSNEIDGVVIATPAPTHLKLAKISIGMGKPTLIEKPLVLSVKEAKELHHHTIKHNGKVMVGHLLLFHPAINKMKSLVEEGYLGDLQYIYSNRLNFGKVRESENVFWSFAPHDISIFQYFLGEFPSEVISQGGAFLQPDIHDTSMTYFKYPSGIQGHIFVNWLHPFKEHRIVLIGSKGSLHFEDAKSSKPLTYFKKNQNGSPIVLDQSKGEFIEYEQSLPLTNELEYFVDYVNGAPIEKANLNSGMDVIKILEMATHSLNKKSLPISPLMGEN